MRLFLAIDPDDAARTALAAATARLRSGLGAGADDWRWVGASLVHVTMHFLGERDEAEESRIRTTLGHTIARPAFDVTASSVGLFPPRRPPQVLWIGLGGGVEALADVHGELAARLAEAGVMVESRPFSPHVTMARARRGARVQAPRETAIEPIGWRVDRVTLYASDLSGPAPRYAARHVVRLADAP